MSKGPAQPVRGTVIAVAVGLPLLFVAGLALAGMARTVLLIRCAGVAIGAGVSSSLARRAWTACKTGVVATAFGETARARHPALFVAILAFLVLIGPAVVAVFVWL